MCFPIKLSLSRINLCDTVYSSPSLNLSTLPPPPECVPDVLHQRTVCQTRRLHRFAPHIRRADYNLPINGTPALFLSPLSLPPTCLIRTFEAEFFLATLPPGPDLTSLGLYSARGGFKDLVNSAINPYST